MISSIWAAQSMIKTFYKLVKKYVIKGDKNRSKKNFSLR